MSPTDSKRSLKGSSGLRLILMNKWDSIGFGRTLMGLTTSAFKGILIPNGIRMKSVGLCRCLICGFKLFNESKCRIL